MSKPSMTFWQGRKAPRDLGTSRIWVDAEDVITALLFDGHTKAASALQNTIASFKRLT